MTKYVKLIDNRYLQTLTNENALNYLDETELNNAGFKEFVPAKKEQGKPYRYSYEETATQIIEHVEEIIPDPADILKMLKETKIAENDEKRDAKLNGGIVYKSILFDSDTDQKVNLLAIVSTMGDEDTITWFGMENEPLECNKADLINIGGLITTLHGFCWAHNAEIKEAIKEATTEEELNAIDINYEVNDEN